jgi:hypothetical protein
MGENNKENSTISVLARSLTYLLNINEGIVIEVVDDMENPFDDTNNYNKIIIYNDGNNIVINEYDGDAEDGDFVNIIDENIMLN